MNTNSRYAQTPLTTVTLTDGREVACLLPRTLPQPEDLAEITRHEVTQGERLDHIAAKYLQDPTLFWQLCDANRALHPAELEAIGRQLRITLPPGIPAGTTFAI